MKKDINFPKVAGVELAIVKKTIDGIASWYVYILNNNNFEIENVLVVSSGYGEVNGKQQKTSVLRHMIENIQPRSSELIEHIQTDVFHLTNQYWVSYYKDGEIYDKKFIFLPDSIIDEHLINIPQLNLPGILHK